MKVTWVTCIELECQQRDMANALIVQEPRAFYYNKVGHNNPPGTCLAADSFP